MGYDKETEYSNDCKGCPLWRENVGCLHSGMGLYWDTDNEGNETELLCKTDTSDPELYEMYGLPIDAP
jgi:hypothetical protein